MKQRHLVRVLISTLLTMGLSQPVTANVFINEIHYDNTGGDTGEFIELAGTAGTDLNGWSVVFYNGASGAYGTVYGTHPLGSTVLTDQCMGTGVFVINYLGIQNGSPDGVALIDSEDNVIEFLSYEGSFTATNGPANGLTSTDILVSETPALVGQSLQRETATDWTGPLDNTAGACNSPQRLADVPPTNIPAFGPFAFAASLLGLLWFGRRRRCR